MTTVPIDHRLIAYGTLRPGEPNFHVVEHLGGTWPSWPNSTSESGRPGVGARHRTPYPVWVPDGCEPLHHTAEELDMNPTDLVDKAGLRDDIPEFAPGDTVKVHVRVVEGNRERIQVFEGAVIARQGSGIRETFTVRKVSFGVGVERTFPVHTPIIDKIERVTRGDVRRAKLYYQRDRIGKRAKIKEKRD